MAAGDAVSTGTTDFTVEVDYRHEFQQGQGWVHVYTYEGPESGRAAREIALRDAGALRVVGTKGQPSRIVATIPDASLDIAQATQQLDLASDWTLTPYDLGKELGTHGKFNATGTSPSILTKIEEAIRKGTAEDTDWNVVHGAASNYNLYRQLRSQGVREYTTFGFTLRRSVTVSSGSTAESILHTQLRDDQGVSVIGKIITWDQIGVPRDVGIEQPYVHTYIGNAQGRPLLYTGDIPGWGNVYIQEWMVKPPVQGYQRAGKLRKRRIDFEWTGAVQWSSTLYDGGSGTP